MKNLKLKKLIYGQTGTIITEEKDPRKIIEEIEAVRSEMSIEGYIFRPEFAKEENLVGYSEEDWLAILAQYSMTYGWTKEFNYITNKNAASVLMNYFDGIEEEPNIGIGSGSSFKVADNTFYLTVLDDILTSKTVLRNQQIQILNLMPIKIINMVYGTVDIPINETKNLVISRLVKELGSKFVFNDPDEIVRYILTNNIKNREPITDAINKTELKGLKLHIPTSLKKVILNSVEKFESTKTTFQKFKKFQDFWKKIFIQCNFMPQDKMKYRWPNVYVWRNLIFNQTIETNNSLIEDAKKEGNLNAALQAELNNPGQMLRNLLQYLRYKKGDRFAHKKAFVFPYTPRRVKEDAKDTLDSEEFRKALMETNPKLLWQVYTMLKDKRLYKETTEKKMNGKVVKYTIPLPGLKKDLVKIVKKQIMSTIENLKKEENKKLGKVYISKELKNYTLQFSGRSDTSISLSGEYLSPGSKIDIKEVLKQEDKLLRVGIAWRGEQSCDIDLSMNYCYKEGECESIYYGSPTIINNDDEVIATSSGDITSNSNEIFSTEFIDIDINMAKEYGIHTMVQSAIIFRGKKFKDYEVYFFMSIIDKKDRIIAGRKITCQLSDFDYATQITEDSKTVLGLKFDLKKDKIEVINESLADIDNYTNAIRLNMEFIEAINNRPKRMSVYKALKKTINENQWVSSPNEADLIIGKEEGDNVIHPGKNYEQLQSIIF